MTLPAVAPISTPGVEVDLLASTLHHALLGIITGWAYPRVWRAGFRRGGCGFEISTCDPTLTHSAGWRVPVRV
jgi:hypothetical protein